MERKSHHVEKFMIYRRSAGKREEGYSEPYDDFLNRVITLSTALHYGFTVDDLKEKVGLKEFFGFA